MTLSELRELELHRVPTTFDAEARAAEAQVVAWQWFDGDTVELEPHEFLRARTSRGRRMRTEPVKPGKWASPVAVGFDAEGRVHFTRSRFGAEMLKLFASVETYCHYEVGRVRRVLRTIPAHLSDVGYTLHICESSAGQVTRSYTMGGRLSRGGWAYDGYEPTETRFVYDESGRLICAEYLAPELCQDQLWYTEGGALAGIKRVFPPGSKREAFRVS